MRTHLREVKASMTARHASPRSARSPIARDGRPSGSFGKALASMSCELRAVLAALKVWSVVGGSSTHKQTITERSGERGAIDRHVPEKTRPPR